MEKDGKDEPLGGIADVGEGEEEEPQSSLAPPTTTLSHTTEVTTSTTTTIPPDDTQAPPRPQALPTVPPPLDIQAPTPSGRAVHNEKPETFGLDHPSPITRLPPLMSPSDDMSGQRSPGSGRKKSKPKPLSNKDLIACHQDVARSNRELVEPSTPEFKPTAEWVCGDERLREIEMG